MVREETAQRGRSLPLCWSLQAGLKQQEGKLPIRIYTAAGPVVPVVSVLEMAPRPLAALSEVQTSWSIFR